MPIFKVTMIEEVKREMVAYVEAPSEEAIEKWIDNSPDDSWRAVGDSPAWSEIENVEKVEAAPTGWRLSVAS